MAKHADLTSIHLFAYTGADPGAVGAGKAWIDASGATPVLKVRNSTDTGWDTVGGAGGGLTVAEVDGTPSIAGTTTLQVPNGQLTNPSGTIARLDAAPTVHTHAAADTTSGVFAVARLATGTPDGTKFVRDDGTLAVPSGTNPMTTQDDLIVGGTSGAPARLAKGSDGQVLTVDSGTHHLAWAAPAAGGTTVAGLAPYALTLGLWAGATLSSSAAIAGSNGGTLLIPVLVPAPMTVDSLTLRACETSGARSYEWRVYKDVGAATLQEVAGLNGAESYTATAEANRTTAATTPGALAPGLYWVAVRCSHASNFSSFSGVAINAAAAGFGGNQMQSKPALPALGSTLDAVAATWTKNTNAIALKLNGRTFGQSGPF